MLRGALRVGRIQNGGRTAPLACRRSFAQRMFPRSAPLSCCLRAPSRNQESRYSASSARSWALTVRSAWSPRLWSTCATLVVTALVLHNASKRFQLTRALSRWPHRAGLSAGMRFHKPSWLHRVGSRLARHMLSSIPLCVIRVVIAFLVCLASFASSCHPFPYAFRSYLRQLIWFFLLSLVDCTFGAIFDKWHRESRGVRVGGSPLTAVRR